jgi:hypothetical protein
VICGTGDHLARRSRAEAVDAIGRSHGSADDERVRRERVRNEVADEPAVDEPKDRDGVGRRPTPRDDDRLGPSALADPRDRSEVRRGARIRPRLIKAMLMNLGTPTSNPRASHDYEGTVSGPTSSEHRHSITPAVTVQIAN